MNYIGSKLSLIDFLDSNIVEVVEEIEGGERSLESLVFADLFAGTGVVGYNFKKRGLKVISNDIQHYSYVLNQHLIHNNKELEFNNLIDEIVELEKSTDKLQTVLNYLNEIDPVKGFIYNNYTVGGTKKNDVERMYFTEINAKRCDAIRIKIENWKKNEFINTNEYYSLIACLLESIDKCANTASVYGAFLKKIKASAAKDMVLEKYGTIIDNNRENKVYKGDINDLIKKVEGDILYLDPPYNGRQYNSNYHMLETIAKYDNPELKGKTGLRKNDDEKRSLFCSKVYAKKELEFLINNTNFKYIFLSYNNEGIIDINDIKEIFENNGEYRVIKQEYRRFKASNRTKPKKNQTIEYLHCLIKE